MSIYFDNAATSFPKAPSVAEATLHYIKEVGANIGRGSYQSASEAELTVLSVRESLCRLFHFDEPKRVLFTGGLTAALNQVIKGFIKQGDVVLVSSLEHNAVMRPLVQLGAKVVRIPADRKGLMDLAAAKELIRPDIKLCVCTHASNVCGVLNPVYELSELLQRANIPFVLDAAQTAGHVPIDFAALHLAALCLPAHKGLLALPGVGALLGTEAFLDKLTPLIVGGTGSFSYSEEVPTLFPDRFEAGTLNISGLYAFNAALAYIEGLGVKAIGESIAERTRQLTEGLSALPQLNVLAPQADTYATGVVSVDCLRRDNAELAFALSEDYGIDTRCGLHCAPSAHKTLGTYPQGTIRFSPGHTTREKDVEYLLSAVAKLS